MGILNDGRSKPKGESHKVSLSAALKGRTQSTEHKQAIGFAAVMKYNPECNATSYQDLLDRMSELVRRGFTSRTIAEKLGLKHLTAKKVMRKNGIEYEV